MFGVKRFPKTLKIFLKQLPSLRPVKSPHGFHKLRGPLSLDLRNIIFKIIQQERGRGFLKYRVTLQNVSLFLGVNLHTPMHRHLISPALLVHNVASSDRMAFLSFSLSLDPLHRVESCPLKVPASKVHAETGN